VPVKAPSVAVYVGTGPPLTGGDGPGVMVVSVTSKFIPETDIDAPSGAESGESVTVGANTVNGTETDPCCTYGFAMVIVCAP
jgi:hypothetical protein